MGKNKAQRTKNNAKPSNSSRSAELLGTSIPNFVGFSAVKDGGYVPVLPGLSISAINDLEINTIDPNFQLVFKKMNKKDCTTKFKALQEFAEMCKDSPLSSVEAVLPFWPRLYCALAVDIEHRVREAAQLAHAALVKRVGRTIATYLKQLAGPWFTSQFDTYPLAASAASNSFQSTFPNKKIIDAIVHCQEEILSYICDNITVQTSQSMCTQKSLTPEELETKYQRILICSLQGYSNYLKKVPSQQIEKTIKLHQQIISSAKFWKLGKHETLLIKTAFFNALASIIENAPHLLKEEKKRTMTTIMNSLDETEPGISSAVWECMLVAIDKTEDWHQSVSIEKLVLPKLWRVLRSGGQGCASVVYPSLLPFLSQFPKFNVDNKQQLFINFFENMRQGFNLKNVLISRSEMMAITKSFVECLKYTVLLNNENVELCVILLREQLMPVVESCIKEFTAIRGILLNEVTQLIRYWSKNRNNQEARSFSELVRIFWEELELMFQRLINGFTEQFDKAVISSIHDAQIKFLMSLKSPSTPPRKNVHVKFADSDDVIEQIAVTRFVEDDPVFLNELEQFVNKLCITYVNNTSLNYENSSIVQLNRLVSNFESRNLFVSLAEAHRNDENLLEFYNESLKCWLVEESDATDAVIEFVFTLLRYMSDEDKETVLKSLTNLDNNNVLNSAITCALKEKNRKDQLVKKWLAESHVTKHLIDIAEQYIRNHTSDDSADLILSLAFESSDGELSVSEEAINEISNILCQISKKAYDASDAHIVELILQLLQLSWTHKKLTVGGLKLLKTLFELSLRNSSLFELQAKWKNGFCRVQEKLAAEQKHQQLFEIQADCLGLIYEKIYHSGEKNIDELVNMAVDLVEASSNYDAHSALKTIIEFSYTQTILFNEWIPEATDLVLHGEIISGNFHLVNPLRSIPCDRPLTLVIPNNEKPPDKTGICLSWALSNAKLLNRLISKFDEDEINDEVDSALDDCSDTLPNLLNSILLITSIGNLYQNYYKFSIDSDSICEFHEKLVDECTELRNRVPKFIWSKILESVDIDTHWIEFGSIFSQFLKYLNGNDDHLLNVKSGGIKFLDNYLNAETPKTLAHHLNAVILCRNLVGDDECNARCINVLKKMIQLHQNENFLLINGENGVDISTIELSGFYLPLEVIRLFARIVKTIPALLDTVMWDAVMIYLASWQYSVNKSRKNDEDLKVRCFVAAVSELSREVQNTMDCCAAQKIDGLPPMLTNEWNEVFAEDVHRGIATTWMYYGDLLNTRSNYLTPIIVLNYLGKSLKYLDKEIFFKNPTTDNASLKITSNQVIKFCLKLFPSPVTSLQISANCILDILIPKLVEQDKALIESESFDSKSLNIRKFEESLLSTQKIVNAMLMDFKLCDGLSCIIAPHSDAYTYTLAYLLEWANVLNMCAHAHADLRYQYAEMLKDELFPCLMNNIFRLMPVEVLQENKSRMPIPQLIEIFRNPPALNFGMGLNELRLDHFVCWIYSNCLRHLPVLARQWWSTTESRVSNAVEKITTLYVSPILCQEELLNKRLSDVANLQIKVHPTAREVVALYQMDDTKLELSMVLPVNHPLGPVTVEPGQHAGGAANWRNCHMQLSIFLTHQNGSIWEGLMMWKKNLDKKFAGVEECYICFSIFHINTYQIPKLSCHTCRKKFHAPCLYKWFSTSQKSTCPICRNIF